MAHGLRGTVLGDGDAMVTGVHMRQLVVLGLPSGGEMNTVAQLTPFCAVQGPKHWDVAAYVLRPSTSVEKRLSFGSGF